MNHTAKYNTRNSEYVKAETKKQYELLERITLEGAHYEVNKCTGPQKLIKIQPFQWDNRRNLCWPMVFEGSLDECDDFVETLIKSTAL